MLDAAFLLRDRLSDIGFVPFVKTTGGKGLHVVIPVKPQFDWPAVIPFAEGFAVALAKAEPARFTGQLAKKARKGRIFIDYLRNGRTSTAVAAYSLRARAGLPVATPVGWDKLEQIEDSRGFSYRSVPELPERAGTPRPTNQGPVAGPRRRRSSDIEAGVAVRRPSRAARQGGELRWRCCGQAGKGT